MPFSEGVELAIRASGVTALNHMWGKSVENIVFTEPITSETWADANKRFAINV